MGKLLILVPVVLAIMIYAFVDLLLSDERRVRAMPRWAWAALIIVLPLVGAVLWLVIGKDRTKEQAAARRVPTSPDDDPDFLAKLGKEADQDERIRRLEEQLSLLDDDGDPDGAADRDGNEGDDEQRGRDGRGSSGPGRR